MLVRSPRRRAKPYRTSGVGGGPQKTRAPHPNPAADPGRVVTPRRRREERTSPPRTQAEPRPSRSSLRLRPKGTPPAAQSDSDCAVLHRGAARNCRTHLEKNHPPPSDGWGVGLRTDVQLKIKVHLSTHPPPVQREGERKTDTYDNFAPLRLVAAKPATQVSIPTPPARWPEAAQVRGGGVPALWAPRRCEPDAPPQELRPEARAGPDTSCCPV